MSFILSVSPKYTPQKCVHRHTRKQDRNVHDIIYNHQKLETAQGPSTVEWKSKLWYVHTMEHYATMKRNEH